MHITLLGSSRRVFLNCEFIRVHAFVDIPHSIKAKLAWKMQTGKSMATYSTTCWWSKWEVMKQVMIYY